MSNNITIKDANNANVILHTIEDATSVHFNQSIPTDIANNTATVVSGGQAVASGMGALVVAQRDALPTGANHIGKVSVVGSVSIQQTGGLFVQAQGMYMATPPTLVDATVSTLQVDQRGSLRVTLMSPDSNGGIGKTSSFTDANINNQNRVVAETYPMVYNAASNTWDRITGTSVGINTVGKARYNATVPTHADATVSVLQMGLRGALHTQIQGGDSTVTWSWGADNVDGVSPTTAGVPKVAGHTKIWNTAGSTWDRWDGKVSVGNTNNIPVSIAGVPNVNIAGAVVSNTGTAIITFGNSALYTVGFNYGWDGTNWRRIDVDTNGKANVSISNTLNIGVSVAPPAYNLPVSVHPVTQSGTWNVGLNAGTNLIGAVSVRQIVSVQPDGTANWPVSIANALPAGTNLIGAVSVRGSIIGAVSIANIADVSVSPNGLNIPVSVAQGRVSVNGMVTVMPAANFAAAIPAGGYPVGGEVSTGNGTFASGVMAPLQLDANGRLKIAGTITGGSMTQTVGAAVTAEGYPMLGSDGTLARRLLTTTGGALVVHVSNAQPTPSGISMTQTVGAAVTTEGYPMLGSDGTNARRLLTTAAGAMVVHVSNLQPAVSVAGIVSVVPDGTANWPVSIAGTANVSLDGVVVSTNNLATIAATNRSIYTIGMNYAWDGTTWRTISTDTGGRLNVNASLGGSTALIGSVSISPNGLNIPVSVANTINVATHPVTQSGTWNIGAITSINSIVKVSIEGTFAPGGAGSMTQTVGAAVTTQGYPMLGTDGTNARGLLTTTGGALIVHVSNTAPGGGAGGGGTVMASIGGAVSNQAVQIAGSDTQNNARTIKTNVSGAVFISTRTFMSQAVFTRPADTTAYAAGTAAAPGAAGDLIANSTTNTAVVPLKFRVARSSGQNGGVAYIRGARMFRTGGTLAAGQHNITGAIRLHLFNTNNRVSVANGDNGAFLASPVSNWMGYIDLVAIACAPGLRTSGAVSTQVYWGSPARTGEMLVNLSATQVSIQGLLETRVAFTPIASEVFTVQIEGFNG